jgi:hypothetical protein
MPVEVVVDIKIARKTRTGALGLVPRSVAPLPLAQVGKTPLGGGMLRKPCKLE